MGHFKMYYALEGERLVRSMEEKKMVEEAMETLKQAQKALMKHTRFTDLCSIHI